jgi:hypothetical protein
MYTDIDLIILIYFINLFSIQLLYDLLIVNKNVVSVIYIY